VKNKFPFDMCGDLGKVQICREMLAWPGVGRPVVVVAQLLRIKVSTCRALWKTTQCRMDVRSRFLYYRGSRDGVTVRIIP